VKIESYQTPSAVDQSIKDAAREKHKQDNLLVVSELIEQEYMNRFLSRVFHFGNDNWVLKGGTGILARIAYARATVDIDLLNLSENLDDSLQILIGLAKKDLGDFFRFEYLEHEPISDGETQSHLTGYRVKFQIYIGQTQRGALKVDLVSGSVITGDAKETIPTSTLYLPRMLSAPYRLYPITDQLADKICAIIETHHGASSSRVKDLIDLVEIIIHFDIPAPHMDIALAAESQARNLILPKIFSPPNTWGKQYSLLANKTRAVSKYTTFADAIALTSTFVNTLLQEGNTTNITWNHKTLKWG
jgi:hypothetical protein